MSRVEVMACQELPLQWSCIWIEEPFTRMNTAHSVYNTMIFELIKQTFMGSFETLNTSLNLNAFLTEPPLHLLARPTLDFYIKFV